MMITMRMSLIRPTTVKINRKINIKIDSVPKLVLLMLLVQYLCFMISVNLPVASSFSLSHGSTLKTTVLRRQSNIQNETPDEARNTLQTNYNDSNSSNKIQFYNSLTRTKEPFIPLSNTKYVSMYTCGPTVYDYAHVGNFRAFLTYDIVKRTLTYFGYNVTHICNLTDVDDKIIAKCTKENKSLLDITTQYTQLFYQDLQALNIIPANQYPKATEHIQEMVQLVLELQKNGLAYQSQEGSWYFNVANKKGYGQQLVQLDVEQMKPKASGVAGMQRSTSSSSTTTTTENITDADEYDTDKIGIRDFALWKAYKPNFDRLDATWDTPLGKGRPGWHLECSAMARKYLGDTIDIHCGGIDLKFPHHENEIAQSEGVLESEQKFCNCWLHNGFVNIGDEKMSKSKGNFLTLRTACPSNDDVRAYRYLVVSSQYRNPLSFTKEAMNAAKGALKRMDNILQALQDALSNYNISNNHDHDGKNSDSIIFNIVQKELSSFETAIADDLSMPRAAASLFGVIKAAENEFKRFKKAQQEKEQNSDGDAVQQPIVLDLVGLNAAYQAMLQMDQVFGIFYQVPDEEKNEATKTTTDTSTDNDGSNISSIPQEVLELVQARSSAKNAKNWALADELRNRVTELGYTIKDVKGAEPIVSRIE